MRLLNDYVVRSSFNESDTGPTTDFHKMLIHIERFNKGVVHFLIARTKFKYNMPIVKPPND